MPIIDDIPYMTVSDILRDPMGTALPNRSIRVTAATTSLPAAKSLEINIVTDETGFYEFYLASGVYLIEVKYDDTFVELGYVQMSVEVPE